MNVIDMFVILSKAVLIAFLYSFAMYWLVIPAILPFILMTFIPKIKNILLKDKSIIYWIVGGFISHIVFIVVHIVLFFFKFDIDFTYLVLLGAVIFNIYSTIYLLLFKFLSNNVQKRVLNKKDKYFLLGLNAIYSLLFPTLVFIIVEYDMVRTIVRFFDGA